MVVLVPAPSRRRSVHPPPSARRYAMSYDVIGSLPVMSGSIHVTSSSEVGELDDRTTDGASGRGGASSTSVTRIVTVTVTAGAVLRSCRARLFAPLVTLTITEYDCLDSWSSTAPRATRIWPVAGSIVKSLEPEIE